MKARSVASIRSILKNGLDRAFLDEAERSDREPVRHSNIRAATTSTEQKGDPMLAHPATNA